MGLNEEILAHWADVAADAARDPVEALVPLRAAFLPLTPAARERGVALILAEERAWQMAGSGGRPSDDALWIAAADMLVGFWRAWQTDQARLEALADVLVVATETADPPARIRARLAFDALAAAIVTARDAGVVYAERAERVLRRAGWGA